jgi:FkbM family methyltransferase
MELLKYNLKNNPTKLLRFLANGNKNYYTTWVEGHKIYLRRGSTDFRVFKKIFIDLEYNFPLSDTISNIVDVGANIGLSAVFFATKYPKAQIIAVEPEPSNFEVLKMNTAAFPNIKPVLGGINNTPGYFRIKNQEGEHWNFMLEYSAEATSSGRYFTINEILEQFRVPSIDFLKIDIEGGEEVLFRDNYSWLDKVQALSIELHDFILPRSSNNFFKAISEHAPFSFLNYGENHLVVFESRNSIGR